MTCVITRNAACACHPPEGSLGSVGRGLSAALQVPIRRASTTGGIRNSAVVVVTPRSSSIRLRSATLRSHSAGTASATRRQRLSSLARRTGWSMTTPAPPTSIAALTPPVCADGAAKPPPPSRARPPRFAGPASVPLQGHVALPSASIPASGCTEPQGLGYPGHSPHSPRSSPASRWRCRARSGISRSATRAMMRRVRSCHISRALTADPARARRARNRRRPRSPRPSTFS